MAVISWCRVAALGLCLIATTASAASQNLGVPAVDFATPQSVIDLGPSLTPERVAEPGDPRGSWFTITIRNSQSVATARVLTAFSPPGTGFNSDPLPARPTIVQAVPSDSTIIVERALAFGPNAFRVLLPPGRATNLTLHFENATRRHPLLAWTESALITNNRQSSILDGLIFGLLTASALISAGAAILSSRLLAGWAALFLFAVLMADLTASGFLDETALAALSGPYSLFALWTALAVAAAIRIVDYVAPFEAFWRDAVKWRDRVALAVVGIGVVAYAAAPVAGLLVRIVALLGAAAAAGYLSHCGRIGVAAARRLAPAAAIFALVTTAAGCNALGFFGVNLTASAALSGFSAAGALLVALASTIPAEHSVGRLRGLREIHGHSDLQATTTDEAIEREWEAAAVAASQQGVFDLDLESGMLSLSPEAAVLFGFPPAPAEAKTEIWKKRIAQEDWDLFRQTMIAYRNRPDTPFRVEFRLVTGDQPCWCELRATITGRSDSAEHCLGLIADITARKSADPARRPYAGALSG